MSNSTLSIPDLRATVTGAVIAPGDPGYDEARTVFEIKRRYDPNNPFRLNQNIPPE